MRIQFTEKAERQLGLSHRYLTHIGKTEYPDGLYDWNADVMEAAGMPCLLLMNNLTRYPVLVPLPDMENQEISFDRLRYAIVRQLGQEGISEAYLEVWTRQAKETMTDRTSSRALIRYLRRPEDTIRKLEAVLVDRDGAAGKSWDVLSLLGRMAARERICIDGSYDTAADRMFGAMERIGSSCGVTGPLFDENRLVLDAEEGSCKLRLLVPGLCSVLELERILERCFCLKKEVSGRLFSRTSHSDSGKMPDCAVSAAGTVGPKIDESAVLLSGAEPIRSILEQYPAIWYKSWMGDEEYHVLFRLTGEEAHSTKRTAQAVRICGRHPFSLRQPSLREVNRELEWVTQNAWF